MQHPNLPNNHQHNNKGGYSQRVCFILILIIAQYERSYYYLYFEGQEPEAREIIKLPKGTQFTSWGWSQGLNAGSLAPGLYF